MKLAFYLIFLLFVFWAVTMIRFQCTNIDRDACASICERNGKVFKQVIPGIRKQCICVTDWLKRARQEEAIRRRLKENRRP